MYDRDFFGLVCMDSDERSVAERQFYLENFYVFGISTQLNSKKVFGYLKKYQLFINQLLAFLNQIM